MPSRQTLLTLLTAIGFLAPNVMLIVFFSQHGLDVGRYGGNILGTLPAAQFTADLTICFIAFTAWTAWDGPRTGVQRWWVTIPASLLVGLCFALPLYLLMRERRSSS